MAKDYARAFYSSGKWIRCKESFIAERIRIDGGLCEDCHERLGKICHHWPIPLTSSNISIPEVSLNHDNLKYVCKVCHDHYPGHGVGDGLLPKIYFDEDGNPMTDNADSPRKQ